MAAWNSSSLAASDLPRHKNSGLLKNGLLRHSKQHMVEKKMFGNKKGMHGKDFLIGKKFKSTGAKDTGVTKPMSFKGISPSVEEFDKMMSSSVTHNPNKKKTPISKKFFG